MSTKCITIADLRSATLEIVQTQKKDDQQQKMPMAPISFPSAILSIDPGEVNFGVCVFQLDPAWVQEAQVKANTARNPECIESWEIPKYRVILWTVINCNPKSTNKANAKKQLSEVQICTNIANLITKIVVQSGVRLVYMEEQLDAARRNRMVEVAVIAAVTAINNFSPCELVRLHATQKFDFLRGDMQNVLVRARNRVTITTKLKSDSHAFRKAVSREVVAEIMALAVESGSTGLASLGLEFIHVESFVYYDKYLKDLAKTDDTCDTLLQIIAQLPLTMIRVTAQNRFAVQHNHTLGEQAFINAATSTIGESLST